MDDRIDRVYAQLPQIGCLLLAGVLCLLCLMPLIMVEAMQAALAKLHLSGPAALAVVLGIILGGAVNLPLYRVERGVEQIPPHGLVSGWMGWSPPVIRRAPTQTIVAVNLGGCVIPTMIALYELSFIAAWAPEAMRALAIAAAVNIAACYLAARPIPGVGIAMPGLLAPAVAVGGAWLLLMPDQFDQVRAPTAFIAGVAGPLIGADLFHLRDFTKVSVGVISIGGAGTFDGIVLSGMLAALLA